jgi:hypothetical protein
LNAVCLFVAGVLRATLPGTEFTLAWDHSVEKTRWEERYRIDDAGLRLIEARVQGSGAGMDPPPGAHLHDGWWTWQPPLAPLAELRLTVSTFTRDYDLCRARRCRTLRSLAGTGDASAIVDIRPCRGKAHE